MSNVEMKANTHNWAKDIVDYYSQGYSDAEVAAAMSINMRQFNAMLGDNPTFAKLVEYGRTLQRAFWEGLARKNISNKTFNAPLYKLYMANKFGWTDKVESSNVNENTNLNEDQLRAEIEKRIKKINNPELTDAMIASQPTVQQEKEDD